VSADDAQWAGQAVRVADVNPKPRSETWRRAMARELGGSGEKPSSCSRHVATAASWLSANSWVRAGDVVRSMWLQRGLAQKRRSSEDACRSSRAGIRFQEKAVASGDVLELVGHILRGADGFPEDGEAPLLAGEGYNIWRSRFSSLSFG